MTAETLCTLHITAQMIHALIYLELAFILGLLAITLLDCEIIKFYEQRYKEI